VLFETPMPDQGDEGDGTQEGGGDEGGTEEGGNGGEEAGEGA
jgi:hypothetical protein